jgi:hypothetical protein
MINAKAARSLALDNCEGILDTSIREAALKGFLSVTIIPKHQVELEVMAKLATDFGYDVYILGNNNVLIRW